MRRCLRDAPAPVNRKAGKVYLLRPLRFLVDEKVEARDEAVGLTLVRYALHAPDPLPLLNNRVNHGA